MSPFKFSSKPPVSLGKSFSPAKRGKFQIYDVAKWKMHYQVKKNEVTIFTDAKVSLRLFSSPFRQREITHPPPLPHFWQHLNLPLPERGRGNYAIVLLR